MEGGAPFNFIIPMRHPASVARPDEQRSALEQLLRSMGAQTDQRFLCHLVVNREQELPPLPAFARRVDVDLAPNAALASAASVSEVYDAIRLDKGLRVRAGMEAVGPDDLVMVVDDDDLVSRSLVAFALEERDRSDPVVWVVDKGYGWAGGDTAYPIDQFHRTCGTSLVVPASRYRFRKAGLNASQDLEATLELGSHTMLVDSDIHAGRAVRRIPFRAAIYRVHHANASQVLVGAAAPDATARARDGLGHRLRRAAMGVRRRLGRRPDDLLGPATHHYAAAVPVDALRSEFVGLP